MKVAYIVDSFDLSIKDIINVEMYNIEHDIDYEGKSIINVARRPKVDEKDYIILKEDGRSFFIGLCDTVDNVDGEEAHTINVSEIHNLWDRKIIIDESNELLKVNVGVEDFLKACIDDNIVNSNDTFLNLEYIEVNCLTHTPVSAKVPTEHRIFNLKTYMANVMENYGVYCDFDFESKKGKLIINIEKKSQNVLKIDTLSTDVDNYVENYEVDVLSKLTLLCKTPDEVDESTGVVTKVGDYEVFEYFLKNDRTITDDPNDPDRAKGSNDIEYIETDDINEIEESVLNAFKSNSYQHSIELNVYDKSSIIPRDELYVGHECEVKTKTRGVKKTIITRVAYSNESSYITLKFGNLAIKLIEKLRKERK